MYFLIISSIFVSILAAIYKVDEAIEKNNLRIKYSNDISFLSTKGYMQIIVFITLVPLIYFIEWTYDLVFLVFILSFARFVFWVLVNIYKGKYKNAIHQSSTNFVMLENFAGPIASLIVFGIYNYINNSGGSIFWYLLTPMIGLFLLWALRSNEDKISFEMKNIIFLQILLIATETTIIIYIDNIDINVMNFQYNYFPFLTNELFLFLIIISISSLFSGLYFTKDIIVESKYKVKSIAFKIGIIAALHDIFYFVSFITFGPIFIIARRGLLIPIQNIYINIKNGTSLKKILTLPFKIPLLNLKGGKDFIISFTDIVFNQIVKFIIKIL